MNFNGEESNIEIIAHYIYHNYSFEREIEVRSDDGKSIVFSFNCEEFDPRNLKLNEVVDIRKYIHWDVSLVTKNIIYVFDITDDILNIIRIDDNLFKLEFKTNNPDMILSRPEGNSFKTLSIEGIFSFIYE